MSRQKYKIISKDWLEDSWWVVYVKRMSDGETVRVCVDWDYTEDLDSLLKFIRQDRKDF